MMLGKRFGVGSGFGFGALLTGVAFWLACPSPARAGLCYYCGGNAATVGDGIVFDELTLDRASAKPEGPFITGVKSGAGVPVTIEVVRDQMFAFDGKHQGVSLAGLVISVAMRDGRAYDITLEQQEDVLRFWAAPQDPVRALIFNVEKTQGRTHPLPLPKGSKQAYRDDDVTVIPHKKTDLCKGTFPEPADSEHPDKMRAALVFTGDHYTKEHTVTAQKKGSFNLACFGTASAKMHLLRHTEAGSTPTMKTTREQRTAMLRAITADYCGDGHPWTADGTPLYWTEREQTFPLSIQPGYTATKTPFSTEIEAIWGTNGKLLCLNQPRRAAGQVDDTCEPPAVSRNMVVHSAVACPGARRLPLCSAFRWDNRGDPSPWSEPALDPKRPNADGALLGAYVVTVNRKKQANYCNRLPSGKVGGLISFP